MNPRLRRALLVVLTATFVVSCGGFICSLLDYREGEQVNAEADALVELPDPEVIAPTPPPTSEEDDQTAEPYIDPYADALAAMDFAALRQVNGEVLGWIVIPGTGVSYPLLQHANNRYYLSHNWKGGGNRMGSIFLEATNSRGLGDFNTIVYGHRMNNGSMFTPLQKFQRQDFWAQHPSVYITTDAGSFRYDIFAAYEVSTEGMTYALGLSTDRAKQRFIDFCLEQSVIDTGLTPGVHDYILTLSTCTGHGHATRWVVQAVRRGEATEEVPEITSEPDDNPTPEPDDTENGDSVPTEQYFEQENEENDPPDRDEQTENNQVNPTDSDESANNEESDPPEDDETQ